MIVVYQLQTLAAHVDVVGNVFDRPLCIQFRSFTQKNDVIEFDKALFQFTRFLG